MISPDSCVFHCVCVCVCVCFLCVGVSVREEDGVGVCLGERGLTEN